MFLDFVNKTSCFVAFNKNINGFIATKTCFNCNYRLCKHNARKIIFIWIKLIDSLFIFQVG